MQKTKKQQNQKTSSKEMQGNIVKGAAGVAVAAGVIAAGVTLMDKERREQLGKQAGKAMDSIQEFVSEAGDEAGQKMDQAKKKADQTTKKAQKALTNKDQSKKRQTGSRNSRAPKTAGAQA